ncbi:hypothetical protein HU200_049140 [Digitaria exilis]|uniref:Uncharacterized protein n=1 Tax=Digitaria exilis TaxID=1010633 RepID=A0A835EBF8_9POAL|nr:hypothetical protein HU200_049140 [Digitaria exilis]
MADLLSTLKQLLVIGFQIKAAFEEAGHNKERCGWIFDLLPTLDAIAKDLEAEGDAKMRGAAAGLENSRRRASRFVAKCREKGLLRRAWDAKGMADVLGWVCLDLLLHLTVTNTSVLTGLRADIASNASMLARILEILDAHPEVHLPEEVAKLVRAYRESNGNVNPQIENKSEAKQTDVPSSQTKSEKDKTDDANTRPQMKTRKSKGPGDSKVVPDADLSDDGLAVSFSSVESGVTKDGSSTIIKKATSSVSKLVDEVQSVAGFARPFQLQQIISVSEVPGKVGSYKVPFVFSKHAFQRM